MGEHDVIHKTEIYRPLVKRAETYCTLLAFAPSAVSIGEVWSGALGLGDFVVGAEKWMWGLCPKPGCWRQSTCWGPERRCSPEAGLSLGRVAVCTAKAVCNRQTFPLTICWSICLSVCPSIQCIVEIHQFYVIGNHSGPRQAGPSRRSLSE